jgi:response regulator RpfG family c-di-GMP phosphodiesterase
VRERFPSRRQDRVEVIIERVLHAETWALSILDNLKQIDPPLVRHMFRVGFMAGEAAISRGFSPEDVYSVILAGALHDIEKPNAFAGIPPSQKLTREEIDRRNEQHTRDGAEVVRPHNKTAAALILAHHDRDYPKKLPESASQAEKKLAELKMILALVDSADGVHKGRPYRSGGPCSQGEIRQELSCFPDDLVELVTRMSNNIIDRRNTRRPPIGSTAARTMAAIT